MIGKYEKSISFLQSIAVVLTVLTILLSQTIVLAIDFVPFGHRDVVWRLANDGKSIYSISADGTLKIWTQNLLLIQSVPTHSSWARAIAVSDKYIAVGGYKPDNTIKIYDKSSLKLVKTLTGHAGSIFSLAFYKDLLISGSSDNKIIVWKNFAPLKTLLVHDGWIREMFVSEDLLVSGDENGRVVVTNLSDFSIVKTFEINEMITSMSGNKNEVFIGTAIGNVYKLVLKDKKIEKLTDKYITQKAGAQTPPYQIGSILCTDDKLFISIAGAVLVYNLNAGRISFVRSFDASEAEITSLTILGNKLFVANRSGEIFTYTIDGKYIAKSLRHYSSSAKVLSSESYLIIARETGDLEVYNKDSAILLWKTNIGKAVRSLAIMNTNQEETIIVGCDDGSIYFIKDGHTIRSVKIDNAAISLAVVANTVCVGTLGTVYLITQTNVQKLFTNPNEWNTCIFQDDTNPSSMYVGTNVGSIYSLNLSKRANEKIMELQDYVVKIIKIDKSIMAITFNGKVYNISTKKLMATLSENVYDALGKNNLLFSVGQFLNYIDVTKGITRSLMQFEAPLVSISTQGNSNYSFVGLSNGQVIQLEMQVKNNVPSVRVVKRFSPELAKISSIAVDDSKSAVVCGHEDGKVSIWQRDGKDSTNYIITRILDDHTQSVKKVITYKDYIISSSADGTIKIWNFENGKLMLTLMGHSSYVWALYVIDSRLISGDWNGKVIVWNIENIGNVYKEHEIQTGLSITDIWADTRNEVYISTLEGYIAKLSGNALNSVKKLRVAKETLWSIDGVSNRIYTAGWDGNVYMLDKNLNLVSIYKSHNSTVFKVAIYKDDIITAGSDNLIKVWKSKGNTLVLERTFSNFRQSILAIALSKETGKIITTDGSSILELHIDK